MSAIKRAVNAVTGQQQQPNYQTLPQTSTEDDAVQAESSTIDPARKARRGRRIKRGVLGAIVVIAVGLFTYGVIL